MWYAVIAIVSVVAVMAAMNWLMARKAAPAAEAVPEEPEEGGAVAVTVPGPPPASLEAVELARLLGEARGLVADLRAALETTARTADDERRSAEAVLGPVRANVDAAEERESDELTVVAARPGPIAVPPPQSSGLRLAPGPGPDAPEVKVIAALDDLELRSGRSMSGADRARKLLRIGAAAGRSAEEVVAAIRATAGVENVRTYSARELGNLITVRLVGVSEDADTVSRAAGLPPAAA
jgi:hypothetical protein